MGHIPEEFRKSTNPIKRMGIGERPGLKELALEVFDTRDGVTPIFPRSGSLIQEALEKAYDLGKANKQ